MTREMTPEDLGIRWAYYSNVRPWYQTMERWSEWSGFPVTPSWSAVAKRFKPYGGTLHDNLMQYAYDAQRYRKELAAEWIGCDWVDVLAGQA